MAVFTPGVSIKSPEPFVVVDAGLALGNHVFELVVINNEGVRSAPHRVNVFIVKPVLPPREPLIPREPLPFPLRGLPGVDI